MNLSLPCYKIILHYDANRPHVRGSLRHGIDTVRPREATHKMWEAHHGGRSVLFTTYRERAELFAELFTDKGLKVSIEPA